MTGHGSAGHVRVGEASQVSGIGSVGHERRGSLPCRSEHAAALHRPALRTPRLARADRRRIGQIAGGWPGISRPSGARAFPSAARSGVTGTRCRPASGPAATLYGGTYNLFAHTLPQLGIEARFADPRDPAAFARLIDARTKLVFCESIGNPLGNVTDVDQALAAA